MSRSALFLLLIVLLSVSASASAVPSQSNSDYCIDKKDLEPYRRIFCFELQVSMVESMDDGSVATDKLKRMLNSDGGRLLMGICSHVFLDPGSPLRTKLAYVHGQRLADKLQAVHLCDEPAACQEVAGSMVGHGKRVRVVDYKPIMSEYFAPYLDYDLCDYDNETIAGRSPAPSPEPGTSERVEDSTDVDVAIAPSPTASIAIPPAASHGSNKLVAASLLETVTLIVLFGVGLVMG